MRLSIGGARISIEASPLVLEAVSQRYGRFAAPDPRGEPHGRDCILEVRERPGRFQPTFEPAPEPASVECDGERLVLRGAADGWYDASTRRGLVENVTGLGGVDALVRVALSTCLPLDGSLLVHAAAVRRGTDGGVALCGASGSGKSTARDHFEGACDELAILTPAGAGIEIHSTPYWNGIPFRARCGGVVCLERGGEPALRATRGAEALRALAQHLIRYTSLPRVEHAILNLAAEVCRRMVVTVATCPQGAAFLPFLSAGLLLEEAR